MDHRMTLEAFGRYRHGQDMFPAIASLLLAASLFADPVASTTTPQDYDDADFGGGKTIEPEIGLVFFDTAKFGFSTKADDPFKAGAVLQVGSESEAVWAASLALHSTFTAPEALNSLRM
jgi:hypothetical protein